MALLQLINKSLASQCLATPENDEEPPVDNPENGAIELASSSATTPETKQKGVKRHDKKNAVRLPTQPNPGGASATQSPCLSEPARPLPMASNARSGVPIPVGSFMGPVYQPHYPQPPYTGPFNYLPPPFSYPYMAQPPTGPVPFLPQNGPSDHHLNFPHLVPPYPQPRTSSPLPEQCRPSQPSQQEDGYTRWIMCLEQGGYSRPGLSAFSNENHLAAPIARPPMPCEPVVVPVGFLPNGCYGPIVPHMYQPQVYQQHPQAAHQLPQVIHQHPQVIFPGSNYPEPIFESARMTNV